MEPNIIAIDPYVVGFVKNNWVSITLFVALLKGIAVLTPGATDDKIATLIGNLFGMVKPKSKPPVNNTGPGQ